MSFLSIINMKLIGELPAELVEGKGFDSLANDLQQSIQNVLNKYSLSIIENEIVSHDLSIEHFTQCSSCSSWLIDRTVEEDREDVDDCIKNGAQADNQILCCDCLPKDNTWAWQHI